MSINNATLASTGGQSIINVLMDEGYVYNGWGEGELDVILYQTYIKVPWAEMITTMQAGLEKGLCALIYIRIRVLFSSSCVENMLLPPAMPRDEV